ncbi:MAG: hypothetical protein WBA12_12435 [Catalinimonas sp.]
MRYKTLLPLFFWLVTAAAAAQGGLKVRLQVWLEGPYQADTMRTTLRALDLLAEHYTAGGTLPSPTGERMAEGATVPSGAVDVIKVELRRDPDFVEPLATAYGWLMSDGTVRDFRTGLLPYVHFTPDAQPEGNYRVVLKHRNHLAAMSSGEIFLRTTAPAAGAYDPAAGGWDFSLLDNLAGGSAKRLVGMRYGLIAGDGAQDSRFETNARDFEAVTLATREGVGFLTPRYVPEDVNLDGVVNAHDYEITSRAADFLYFVGFEAGQP